MYNYFEAVKDDVKQYIEDNEIDINDEDIEEQLNDDLWTEDSVTGNGSGSYTMNREKAKEYLFGSDDGEDSLMNAISDYDLSAEDIGKHFMSQDWEWFDVTIRCYLLGQAIAEALEEMR